MVASLVLSAPQHFQINLATREFGQSTDYRLGDYQESYFEASQFGLSLAALPPEGYSYRLDYPDQS